VPSEFAPVKGWVLAMLARLAGGLRVVPVPGCAGPLTSAVLDGLPDGRSAPRNIGALPISPRNSTRLPGEAPRTATVSDRTSDAHEFG
jgi:hypothetical protein